jgi:hypothetical protein
LAGERTWREAPELAAAQFAVFPVLRQLHEMLWYLTEAATLPASALDTQVGHATERVRRLTGSGPDELSALDVGTLRAQVGELLGHLRGVYLGRADLLGADLRAADIRGADLSGCLFLTRPQVTAARGDLSTRLPSAVPTPAHWAAAE